MSLPKDKREMLLSNVWCGHCGDVTTIVDYDVKTDSNPLFLCYLEGKCKKCGKNVCRVIEKPD